MHKTLILITLGVALASCQSQMRALESGGAIRVEPSNVAGADYVVHLRNTVDFGYNPDDKANRDKFALQMLQKQCPTGRIVKETSVETGTYALGRVARTYFVYVKCQ